MEEEKSEQEIDDEEALRRIAEAMKDSPPVPEDKHNIHTFLVSVVKAEDSTKIGNLQVDRDINELGIPEHTVRGAKDMALISDKIMENEFFKVYFEREAENTLASSLSREGFLDKLATMQTKQVVDATKRRKINKGWFGSKKVEESGGDITSTSTS